MRVSQVVTPGASEVVTRCVQEPGAQEVIVKVSRCGVCASELPLWRDAGRTVPFRLGHEPFGVVESVGANVTRFTPGDRVTGLFKEAFGDYCTVPEDVLLPVPDEVGDDSAMGEPLACLVNAARRTPIEFADTLVIVGLGYMGLGLLQLLRLRGAARIVAIDVREESLAHARIHGATEAYTPDTVPEDLFLTEFGRWQSDAGAHVVVEASGTAPGLELAGKLVKAHGTLSILGYHQGAPRQVDVGMWNWKAIDVVNAHVRRTTDLLKSMRIGLELERSGLIDTGALVTHRFGLDSVDDAFQALVDKPEGFIKSVVVP
jgi:threonine dehydrogenase-like Zn-dependent dehydrogenase